MDGSPSGDQSEWVTVALVDIRIDLAATVGFSKVNLTGSVDLKSFAMKLRWSTVGTFGINLLDGIIQTAVSTVVVPLINEQMAAGFPLPVFQELSLTNPALDIEDGILFVCSDFVYSPNSSITPASSKDNVETALF